LIANTGTYRGSQPTSTYISSIGVLEQVVPEKFIKPGGILGN